MEDTRRIAHVDMDAFYASVEQRDHPSWRGYPVIVAGDSRRGVVAAASYEARKYGIFSAMPVAQALKLCPDVIRAQPRFSVYRQVSQQVHAVFRHFTELVEPLALDESFLDLTEFCRKSGRKAGHVALEIKQRIREETGLTASAGVGPSKMIAKIASGFRKPDGLTIVPPEEVKAFLHPLPIGALWGVGPVTQKRFEAHGIFKVADLAQADLAWLRAEFGNSALAWQSMADGHDDRPVVSEHVPKSLSSETTFEHDVRDVAVLQEVMAEQADEVARRLANERMEAATVNLKIRYSDFTTLTRSHTGARSIRRADQIAEEAVRLLAGLAPLPPVRLIGVGVSGLLSLERPHQLEFDFV